MSSSNNLHLEPLPQPAFTLRPETRDRSAIPTRYKWNLSHIYTDWELWETDYASIKPVVDEIVELKGRLAEGPQILARAYELMDRLGMVAAKVGGYAHLSFDSDQRDQGSNAQNQKVRILGAQIGAALSWFTPELLAIHKETILEWLADTPALEPHRFGLMETYRQKEHILDEAGEKLMAYSARAKQASVNAYEMLTTADAVWPELELSAGKARITEPTYAEVINTNRNQSDRRAAFKGLMGVYKSSINTFAALYDGVCERDWSAARSRSYPSCLERALSDYNIPLELYSNLINVTKQGLDPLRRYHHLRKRVLGLESYDLYDGGIPLIADDRRWPFDSVAKMIIESVAPLGEAYVAQAKRALEGGWIDVYENEGKRTGAYSMGVYGVHPYMLMNYNDTLDNVFTLAHELGHTLHTMHSHQTQPFPTSQYTIFVAEVASTMNEALLLDYMLKRASTPEQRITLLEHSIDQIIGTFYSQVRFAEFEWEIHKLVESGKPLTSQVIDKVFYGQLKEAFEGAMDLDPLYAQGWSRIPHFFRTPFYVYQYATSFAASAALSREIIPAGSESDAGRERRVNALERYLTLLRSGGNDHPIDQLRRAGVDMTSPDPVQAVIELMNDRVTQLEAAFSEMGRA